MLRLQTSWILAVPLACALGAAAAPRALAAQQPAEHDGERIERIVFPGAETLDDRELRRSIVLQQTRCRTMLLRPFCWLTDWSVFVEKHYLEAEELPRDELRLEVFHFRRGFREAGVEYELRPRGRGVEIVFRVEEGPATRIESLDVEQAQDVLGRRELRRAGLPREGQRLDLVRLDTMRSNLRRRLAERGFLDAVVRDTVAVDEARAEADVRVLIDPGRRSTIADLDVRGNERVSDAVIERALRLRRGRVLRSGDLLASERSLYESNLFHTSEVSVPPQPDSAKVVEIRVREAPPRVAQLGGGFNTVDFVQADGRLVHYNWLGGGRRLDLRATAGNLLAPQLNGAGIFRDAFAGLTPEDERPFLRPTWRASLEFMQPHFRVADVRVGLAVFTHRRIIPAIAVDRGSGLDASITRRLDRHTPATFGYRYELNAVDAGDLYFCAGFAICDQQTIEAVRGRHRLSPLSLNLTSERIDDPLAPTIGHTLRLDVEHASRPTLSDFRYHRLSGDATYHHPFDFRHQRVLAGRLRAGWVRPLSGTGLAVGAPDALDVLHPRKRFYSGGARSVRGFGENQLGPRVLTVPPAALLEDGGCSPAEIVDASCDPNLAEAGEFVPRPLGGRWVVEGNVEYRFPVWRELDGAVFIDAGVVGGRGPGLIGDARRAVTPGFGIRLQTLVGPIRADLGLNPSRVEMLPVVTEFVDDNGERRIVLLETPREYDPLADARGTLGRIVGRLRLHLSIGEPF